MSYGSRILGVLETELSRHLNFTLCDSSGRPLSQVKSLSRQDVFEFAIWLRNDTSFPVKGVHGTISPTRFVKFSSVEFHVPSIEPHDSFTVATIRGVVLERPARGSLLDHLATVSMSAAADLSSVVIQEWDKPVEWAQPSAAAGGTGLRSSLSRGAGTPVEFAEPGLTFSKQI